MQNNPPDTHAPDSADIASLHSRIAELEQRLRRAELFETLARKIPTGVDILHHEDPADPSAFRLIYSNGAIPNAHIDMQAQVGRLVRDIFPNLPGGVFQAYVAALRQQQPIHLRELAIVIEGAERVATMQAIPLDASHLCILVEDITDRKLAQNAQQELQVKEETIRLQQLSLAELSTPIIPITDQVMVMPLIGAVDTHRAQQVISTLLDGIVATRATVVILDITGVPVVDTQVANALLQAAQTVRLLGARVILTGIRPEVAQTLVGLGVDLGDIRTLSSLQMGIAYATNA